METCGVPCRLAVPRIRSTEPDAWFAAIVLVIAASALAGCGGGSNAAGDGRRPAVPTMASLYSEYMFEHKNQLPSDEQAFREYLASKQSVLEEANLTVDDMFRSPRGGQLQWVYGQRSLPKRAGMRYMAYETSSSDGKRLTIGAGGMKEIMSEADFRTVFPNTP